MTEQQSRQVLNDICRAVVIWYHVTISDDERTVGVESCSYLCGPRTEMAEITIQAHDLHINSREKVDERRKCRGVVDKEDAGVLCFLQPIQQLTQWREPITADDYDWEALKVARQDTAEPYVAAGDDARSAQRASKDLGYGASPHGR